MVRPTARVLALLEILQGGGTPTVGGLAQRLDVNERTVRRYVQHLLDLDIPVESVRGRYGGYRLAPGYRMPPLMLTSEEALALLLGLLPAGRPGGATAAVPAADSAVASCNGYCRGRSPSGWPRSCKRPASPVARRPPLRPTRRRC